MPSRDVPPAFLSKRMVRRLMTAIAAELFWIARLDRPEDERRWSLQLRDAASVLRTVPDGCAVGYLRRRHVWQTIVALEQGKPGMEWIDDERDGVWSRPG